MEEKFIIKLITNCFLQYSKESADLNTEDLEGMYQKVLQEKTENPHEGLHDIVNDIVYEYLTQ
ncbi:YqzH family protein [Bacillus sp. FJAT-49736]|uniref:YqzH family protein n=1 Tax=Bacillus sp. FJAT-49736 TaxID=2833582 RepID=UPI001BC8DFDB|nr:YqzH family protein [Bacillus sp. FJAT-49736]MBS4173375.1 hypothetical protein [Bacillus sp. FJAT-49736]